MTPDEEAALTNDIELARLLSLSVVNHPVKMFSTVNLNLFRAYYLALIIFLVAANGVSAREIGPDENLCATINSLEPGETLTLKPGDYRGPCKIRRGGIPGSPTLIEGQILTDRPRIIYEGQSSNVFEIEADHVTLRGLKIGPTMRNIDGVRIFAQAGVTIEDCEFTKLGGIAIAATRNSIDGLFVRRNIIADSAATAMYFGCHDGVGCQITNLLVERNFIRGVDVADPEIGYGIQIKLNSIGAVFDNVIVDTKGPAIMVYGSSDSQRINIIERNFVAGSRQSSGILIGGGPARVSNNIASRNFEGGITLQDYANRGLMHKIFVANNTSFKNNYGEFVVPSQVKLSEVLFALNAATASVGIRAYPIGQHGLILRENIDCTVSACFADPSSLNFSPIPDSPVTRVGIPVEVALPRDDYYGRIRKGQLTAGAIAFSSSEIKLGIKPEH